MAQIVDSKWTFSRPDSQTSRHDSAIYYDDGRVLYTSMQDGPNTFWRSSWGTWKPASLPVSKPPEVSVVTGVSPEAFAGALYGKPIALSCLGYARIGVCGLVFGPYPPGGSTVSFGASFGFPANPEGTRRVYEVSLDGKVVWSLTAGSGAGALDPAGFLTEPFTVRFVSGTMTQLPDPLETAQFGAEAIAYRPQMLLFFQSLPLAKFGNKIPFVSCVIGDTTDGAVPWDGIDIGTALERVAYSPWLEYDSGSFETAGITDVIQGMILTEDQSFLSLLQNMSRMYRKLDILQTDKLRVSDRGADVTPDLELGRDHVVGSSGVNFKRAAELSEPRELELITIDPAQDYVFVPSKASRPRHPVPVTASVGRETVLLPIILGANERMSLVTYSKYHDDMSRRTVFVTTMLRGYELEPGDLISFDEIADGFDEDETFQVVETSHGANFENEITAQAVLKCGFLSGSSVDLYWEYTVLLHGFEDDNTTDESFSENGAAGLVGATTTTSESKFGSYSGEFDGAAWMQYGNNADWDLSDSNSDQFTIEAWVNATSSPEGSTIVSRWGTVSARSFLFRIGDTSKLTFSGSNDGTNFTIHIESAALTWTSGTWYHVAVDKDATGKIRLYRDGLMLTSDTPADSSLAAVNQVLQVGGLTGTDRLIGFLDEVRITKGIARYASDDGYTVPFAAFPRE